MSRVVKQPPVKSKSIVCNFHFWAIILIMAVLIAFYNAYHLDIVSRIPWLREILASEFIHDLHRSLFLIPLLYAGSVFRVRGALLTWIVFLAAILPRAVYFSPNPGSLARIVIFAVIALMVGVLIAVERNHRQAERKAFTELEAARQVYLSRIIGAQEDERKRIAQELHDDTIQSLLVIANHSQALMADERSGLTYEARTSLEEIRDMLLGLVEGVRRLSHDLRPNILDNLGLLPALRWLADRLVQEDNIRTEVVVNGVERRLDPEAKVAIFRIVQESISNIRRHSKATEAILNINFSLHGVKVVVQDNGEGFSLSESTDDLVAESKLGLSGMSERARMIDAAFSICSEPGKGTVVTVEARV